MGRIHRETRAQPQPGHGTGRPRIQVQHPVFRVSQRHPSNHLGVKVFKAAPRYRPVAPLLSFFHAPQRSHRRSQALLLHPTRTQPNRYRRGNQRPQGQPETHQRQQSGQGNPPHAPPRQTRGIGRQRLEHGHTQAHQGQAGNHNQQNPIPKVALRQPVANELDFRGHIGRHRQRDTNQRRHQKREVHAHSPLSALSLHGFNSNTGIRSSRPGAAPGKNRDPRAPRRCHRPGAWPHRRTFASPPARRPTR